MVTFTLREFEMTRLITLLLAAASLFAAFPPSGSDFSKYKKVEAYEIRPGILMMPVYNASEQICEIGLQPRNYSPELIRLTSDMPREEIRQAFDELVPPEARGPLLPDQSFNSIQGSGMTENEEYENVSFQIYSALTYNGDIQDMNIKRIIENATVARTAVSIQFKKQPCK
jgi:hypothetical protein